MVMTHFHVLLELRCLTLEHFNTFKCNISTFKLISLYFNTFYKFIVIKQNNSNCRINIDKNDSSLGVYKHIEYYK